MINSDQRRLTILILFFATAAIFLIRLFYIQVIDDSYVLSSENQALRYIKQFAARGIIYDRNGKKIVYNEAVYDLMVTPRLLNKDFDTTKFCTLTHIPKEEFINKMKKAKAYSIYKQTLFLEQLTLEQFAPIMEKLHLFPAFDVQVRSIRKIPYESIAHIIGYVGEVNKAVIERDSSYEEGDYIGMIGIERAYEQELRGQNGYKIYVANSKNVIKEAYKNGENDKASVAGKVLKLSIDIELQEYAYKLMAHKKGSVVAIDPKTGEILAMVSTPSYNPNLLVGRDRAKNYRALAQNDSLNPLFNRALMAEYPPGSTFKLLQALIALQEGDLSEYTGYPCNKALVGCHDHPNASNLKEAIRYSCNPYFYNVFRNILDAPGNIFYVHPKNLDKWYKHITSFGLGQKLGTDLWGERKGKIPNSNFYNKLYGEHRWAFSTIYSLSIGQGEILVSPLQMTNMAVSLANKGYYYTPHIVKDIEDKGPRPEFLKPHRSSIQTKYFDVIQEGMRQVVEEVGGTAGKARIKDVVVCGKTGTAQNPHGEDHSIFIAFAPMKDPKIAISVYIENAGFGGTWAAPIASLVMEKFLNGSVQDTVKENYILDQKFY